MRFYNLQLCHIGEPHRQIVLGINAPDIVEFKPSSSKPPVMEIDTGSHFQTEMATEDRDELIEWARSVAFKLKFGIIIEKSDFGGDKRKPCFKLVCERSGTYVSKGKKLKTEKTGRKNVNVLLDSVVTFIKPIESGT
ncbi:hypothetical protein QL285_005998 [Trifolium repens]|nr:hypothetical protein QL285_005998 [Trifolium repens]